MKNAHSGFTTVATAKQWWMLVNDADLEELRRMPDFALFERETYPDAKPAPSRPADAIPFALTTYDLQVIATSAQAMEHTWHHRAEDSKVNIHLMVEWFRSEHEIWSHISDMAQGQGRAWTDRAELLGSVSATADADCLMASFPPSVPKFDTLPKEISVPVQPPEDSAVTDTECIDERLSQLALIITPTAPSSPISRSKTWLARLEAADRAGAFSLPAGEVRRVCAYYAGAWQTLAGWFNDLPRVSTDDNKSAFERAVRRIPRANWPASRSANVWSTLRVRIGQR